ncbi:MAG: site-specific integrase, partial [Clostridia bacterium]|nr:site-specific integrase [Clostridia bacterium]
MKHEILQSCPPVIRDFLTYNETIKGKSALSVEGYFLDLQSFFRYLLFVRGLVDGKSEFCEIEIKSVDINLIKTVTISDLYAYLVFCKNERGNNAATRARKTSTLRIFFKYLCEQTHQLEANPA